MEGHTELLHTKSATKDKQKPFIKDAYRKVLDKERGLQMARKNDQANFNSKSILEFKYYHRGVSMSSHKPLRAQISIQRNYSNLSKKLPLNEQQYLDLTM